MRISRRAVLGGAATALGASAHPASRRKPNFLFLIADDHAGYVLGADGNQMARTPNLDRLAAEGMRFARHYCNSPVCTPSRQSFFTGQMPHMAGVTRLPTPLSEQKPTLARQFRAAGYTTAVFGKMHFNRPGAAGMHGFDIAHTEDVITRDWHEQVKPRPIPQHIATKKLPWKPIVDPARIWLNADKLPYPCYDDDMRGSYQVHQAEQFLEQQKNKPFALWVSFMEPHSPYDFPIEYRDKFAASRFTPPRVGPEDAWQIPLIFRDLSVADKQGIAAAYYTSVEFLDRNVGRVLGKLRALDLDTDTYVVYMADHGYDLGQHGRFEKHCGYDPALRVPLLMRFPGRIHTGVVNDMTEHIDVPATIVDVMDLDSLPVLHGRSLRPYLEGKPIEARDHIFSEYLENEEAYIRTPQWKFIYCTGKRARKDGYATDNPTPGRYKILYDLSADPGEFHNVLKEQPGQAARLQKLLLKRFLDTHPEAGHEPPGASEEEMLDWYLRPRDV
jgi:arylsulfatase A-like enzyme